jgi:hypothetical protein
MVKKEKLHINIIMLQNVVNFIVPTINTKHENNVKMFC